MEEIWKDIPEFEGYYQASTLGRIRSVDRTVKAKSNSIAFIKGQIIHPGIVRNYYQVTLWKKHKAKQCYVSRLVAMVFIPNLKKLPYINHIDGNKQNNVIENLEWVTPLENIHHAIKMGLFKKRTSYNNILDSWNNGEENGNSKLKSFQVRVIKKINDMKIKDIAKFFNVSKTTIGSIKNNKAWKHIK